MDRPGGRTWMTGAGLAVVGAGMLLVASTLHGGQLRQEGPVVPVNAGALDGTDPRAHNTPAVARNPTDPSNLAVVDRVDTPQYSCALHVTTNGGSTWEERTIPFPGGEEAPPRCFAPDAAFDASGTLYVSFVTLKGAGNSPNAVWTASSTDGGRTLSAPTRALGPLAFQVRLLADALKPGYLYLTWLQADATALYALPNPANPIQYMRSSDGGLTWTEPNNVSSPDRLRVVAPAPAQGRENELYVLFLELLDDRLDYHGAHEWRAGEPYGGPWRLVLARSVDRGDSWSEVVVDDQVVPTSRILVFLPPSPSLAVDSRRGRVFVAFQDARSGDADVLVWASTNHGATFAGPRRVNDNGPADGTSQYLPRLAVAPDGRLDVVYYDRRGDPDDVVNEVSLQSSADGGVTFGARRRLSTTSFDSRIGFGGDRGLADLGSRLGLVAGDDRVFAFWSDTRRGTLDDVRQDLAVAVLEVAGPSPLRTPLRVLGVLSLAAGVVLLAGAAAVVRGRQSAPTAPGDLPPST